MARWKEKKANHFWINCSLILNKTINNCLSFFHSHSILHQFITLVRGWLIYMTTRLKVSHCHDSYQCKWNPLTQTLVMYFTTQYYLIVPPPSVERMNSLHYRWWNRSSETSRCMYCTLARFQGNPPSFIVVIILKTEKVSSETVVKFIMYICQFQRTFSSIFSGKAKSTTKDGGSVPWNRVVRYITCIWQWVSFTSDTQSC